MSWDETWEHVFSSRDWGRYPPEELVRFVGRNYFGVPDRPGVKMLEIGCGTGANLWFIAREGFDAYGIDGSPTAITKAKTRMAEEGLRASLQIGDVNDLDTFYERSSFDAIIDAACLWCNRLGEVKVILSKVLNILQPKGRIFSMLLGAGSYGDGLGEEVEKGTFRNIKEGPLCGTGLNHFFTLEEVKNVFSGFSDLQIEYSLRSLNNQSHIFKLWVVQGVKG
ncbi:MAG: hypothetical protein A4E62_00415 [Syntrophorhabdus sp. PtaU1.Bin002]|nr:MAG: hypothetical protein A4E58_00932 [Syntrophorhabdus sp. PtaB.Bin006]OPY73564.1 MAG: hypothetical protein A4E62_00415 [Syntrophorhabdus sp. PtaU1.Bin002]